MLRGGLSGVAHLCLETNVSEPNAPTRPLLRHFRCRGNRLPVDYLPVPKLADDVEAPDDREDKCRRPPE